MCVGFLTYMFDWSIKQDQNPKTLPFSKPQEEQIKRENKIKGETYVGLWPFLQIMAYALFTLPKWLKPLLNPT
jgi:hypothetical protein